MIGDQLYRHRVDHRRELRRDILHDDGIDIEPQDAVNLVLPDRTGARYPCLACHLSPARPSSRNSTVVCCRLTAALWPCARSSNAFALLERRFSYGPHAALAACLRA